VLAEDPVPEILITATKSGNTSTNSTPTQNESFSKAGGMNTGPGRAEAAAQEAAAAAAGKVADRNGCLIYQGKMIKARELICQQGFDVNYSAAVGGCTNPVDWTRCEKVASANQSAGYKGCAAIAITDEADLPASFLCKK
jgi:hypothetical protein